MNRCDGLPVGGAQSPSQLNKSTWELVSICGGLTVEDVELIKNPEEQVVCLKISQFQRVGEVWDEPEATPKSRRVETAVKLAEEQPEVQRQESTKAEEGAREGGEV